MHDIGKVRYLMVPLCLVKPVIILTWAKCDSNKPIRICEQLSI